MKANRTLDVRVLTYEERLLIAPNYLDWSKVKLQNGDLLKEDVEQIDRESLPVLYREIGKVLSDKKVPYLSTQLTTADIAVLYGEEPNAVILDHIGLLKKEDGEDLQEIFSRGTIQTLSFPTRTDDYSHPAVFFIQLTVLPDDRERLQEIVAFWLSRRFSIPVMANGVRYLIQPATGRMRGLSQYFAVHRDFIPTEEIGGETVKLDLSFGPYVPWQMLVDDYLMDNPQCREIANYLITTAAVGVCSLTGHIDPIYWVDDEGEKWRVIGMDLHGTVMLSSYLKQDMSFDKQLPVVGVLSMGKLTRA